MSADLPSSTGSDSSSWATIARLKARRPKPQLSCVPCKAKKQKCDRTQPCNNCRKRFPERCIYAEGSGPSGVPLQSASPPSLRGQSEIPNRLRRLEQQLANLTQQAAKLSAPSEHDSWSSPRGNLSTSDDSAELHEHLPRISTASHEEHFISPSHWENVLNELETLFQRLLPGNDYSPPVYANDVPTQIHAPTRPQLLFLTEEVGSKEEFISSLPTKDIFDRLWNIFLAQIADMPLISVMLHIPSFVDQCNRFWQDPTSVGLNWLSIVFSIMALALQNELRMGHQVDGILLLESTCIMYSKKAALCLRAADYARPTKGTVEAMTFSLACEHFWIEKEPYRASLMFGMIVRTAYRMGYHRDPSQYEMSMFDAEMQRRTWALIYQMDLFFAGKCGLPPLINPSQCDTRLPRNLLDDDLHPGMTELPPARPVAERTMVSYLNYKRRLGTVHRFIVDRMSGSQKVNYEEIMQMDDDLVKQLRARPSWLEPPSDDTTQLLTPNLLGPVIDADLIMQRARMILHHRYIRASHTQDRFRPSSNIGLNAAKTALFYQRLLFDASSGNAPSVQPTWRLLSLLTHDFLFAALILSLDIKCDLQVLHGAPQNDIGKIQARIDSHMEDLRSSLAIWKACEDYSAAAKEAHDIIGSMFDRFLRSQTHDNEAFSNTATDTGTLSQLSEQEFTDQGSSQLHGLQSVDGVFGQEISLDYEMANALLPTTDWPDFTFDVYGASMGLL